MQHLKICELVVIHNLHVAVIVTGESWINTQLAA
jgi:hypothetical protein